MGRGGGYWRRTFHDDDDLDGTLYPGGTVSQLLFRCVPWQARVTELLGTKLAVLCITYWLVTLHGRSWLCCIATCATDGALGVVVVERVGFRRRVFPSSCFTKAKATL